MTDLSDSVLRAIEFLSGFHKDVAKLLGSVEDAARTKGLTPLWGAQSMWDRSSAYYGAAGWMARYLCRAYVPAPADGATVQKLQQRLACFLVYLAPRLAKEPTAVWGVLSLIERGDPWPVLKPILLLEDGPPFLKRALVSEWEKVPAISEKVDSFIYRACPLVRLVDADTVERVVVQPLIEIFSPHASEGNEPGNAARM